MSRPCGSPSPQGSFPAAYRLKTKAEFDRVFSRPNTRYSYGPLQAIVKTADPQPLANSSAPGQNLSQLSSTPPPLRRAPDQGARLGLIVAKRLVPLAVQRNRLKRLIREGFRTYREQLPAADIIVRVAKRPTTAVSASDVTALFGKMQRANR